MHALMDQDPTVPLEKWPIGKSGVVSNLTSLGQAFLYISMKQPLDLILLLGLEFEM